MRQVKANPLASQAQAFVLLELVFGIVILSLIAIALVQTTLSLQKQSIAKNNISLAQISLSNTADTIRNYVERESSFVFVDSSLQIGVHTITLRDRALFLDGVLMGQDITRFDVRSLPNKAFSIDLCTNLASKAFCINRVGWLH